MPPYRHLEGPPTGGPPEWPSPRQSIPVAGAGRLLAGRYRLEELVGNDGIVTIFRARDERLGREVAVKILGSQYGGDETFRARFRQEAQTVAGLSHPNVISVFDYGAAEGAEFVVMELVRGSSLAELVAQLGPLPVEMAVAVAAQVASALEAAHSNGLLHRDLKPENIVITGSGQAKVADFGISRFDSEGNLTLTGTTLDSVHYFSPEQVAGEPISASSNIYSLGIVLFESLTGRRPFEAETTAGAAQQRIHEPAPSLAALDASLPRPLVRIVDRTLERRPSSRYGSAAALESALRGLELASPWGTPDLAASAAAPARAGASAGPASGGAREGTFYGRLTRSGRATRGRWAAPPQRPLASVARPPSPPRRAEGRRRRPVPLFLVLGIVAVLGLVGGVFAFEATRGRDTRAIRPGPTTHTGVAAAPTATAEPTVATSAAPTNRPSVAPTAQPSLAPAPQPTTRATTPPTPRPTPPATARPAPQPTPPSTVGATGRTPAQTVVYWYGLIDDKDFDRAAGLWSPRMRAQYPPDRYIDGRFAATDSITVQRATTTSAGATRARVAVDILEIVGSERRRWIGSWDLVRGRNGWLLDDPDF